jgi:two-component system nitrate/nitrite response regulator NarL
VKPAVPNTSSLFVLLVEDDPVFTKTFDRVFAKLGKDWKIHLAPDGNTALKMLAQADVNYDLALVDIGLPDITGIDVIAAVRSRHPEMPVLVTTTFTSEDTFLSSIRAGARGYLLKSDTETALVNAVESVLQGQYPVSPALARYLFRLAGAPTAVANANKLNLSSRELELLQYLAQGNSYTSCAEVMNISLSTVQTHIRNMYRKLEVSNQRQAIKKAQASGLLHF